MGAVDMDTIFITNDSWRAQVAEQAGVDRVMVDLEIIGKSERQKNHDTLISRHSLSDVGRLRSVLRRALLMVRMNPVHECTLDEVNACTAAGADILMLPMISHPAECKQFVQIVGGRSKTCLLLETGAALARLYDIISIPGIDEVHIGLNDLHLALKLDFMFEVVSGGLIEYMAQIIRGRGLKFGIGGIARLGRGLLSPELILSEHVRLGSSQVILSRDYNQIFDECGEDLILDVFRREIEKLQGCIKQMRRLGSQIQAANSRKLKYAVDDIVGTRSNGLSPAVGGCRFPAGRENPIVERL
jgi:2-keto-3-deoxy-L-rhamnonate aldolase RhmA